MSEQRTVTIFIDEDAKHEMRAAVGSEQWYSAIGYLSTWNQTFPHVDIYRDRKTDMVASYRNKDGSRGYTIGAVFNTQDGKYGFHS